MSERTRATTPSGSSAEIAGYDPHRDAGDCVFDAATADLAVDFIEGYCRHVRTSISKQSGEPFKLEPWQRDITRTIFGWLRPDGTRRYREAYIEVPRKNGKTTWLAALIATVLFVQRFATKGGQLYSAASDQDQASLVFNTVADMVRGHKSLDEQCKIRAAVKRIIKGNTFYRAIPADAGGSHGFDATFIAADELHAWPGEKGREFWNVLHTSTGARSEPLTIAITTAGYDRQSVCWEKHTHAINVRDGLDDPAFLPVLYFADESDDWKDPATWRKANPNLGVSVSEDYLARECEKAQRIASYENTFRRLHLNQWTEQDVRWLSLDQWDDCRGDVPDLRGVACFAGLDLSSTTDLASLALVFPVDGKLYVKSFSWIPEENARERELRDRVPYVKWSRDGAIETTEGNVVDYDVIRARINEIGKRHRIKKIAIDRWNATQIAVQLQGDGFEVEFFGQGFASMSGPTKALERRILDRKLIHDGNPVLRWCVGNAAAENDAAGNVKLSKKKSIERIDAAVALVMAVGMATDTEVRNSVYKRRGVIAV